MISVDEQGVALVSRLKDAREQFVEVCQEMALISDEAKKLALRAINEKHVSAARICELALELQRLAGTFPKL